MQYTGIELYKIVHKLIRNHSPEIFDLVSAINEKQSEEPQQNNYLSDSQQLHQILNRRDENRYNSLHYSIFFRNSNAFELLVQSGVDINLKCHGISPIHLLISLANLPDGYMFSYNCLNYLLGNYDKESIDMEAKDDQGSTFFHLAAELSDNSIFKLLVDNVADFNHYLQIKDRLGNQPIHRASQKNSVSVLKYILSLNSSVANAFNSQGDYILHIAGNNNAVDLWNYFIQNHKDLASKLLKKKNIFNYTPVDIILNHGYSIDKGNKIFPSSEATTSSTAIITDTLCLQHHTCLPIQLRTSSAPPENLHRLEVLIDSKDGVLHSNDLASYLYHLTNVNPAPITDILRVHEFTYIQRIKSICDSIDKEVTSLNGLGQLDGDTTISHKSFEAAAAAAGCVCKAVDLILEGNSIKNAFCPIRPPGHHAGPRGVVKSQQEGPDSHGFCLFNNISIGAAYAMNRYRDVIKKVAIVDFDVHHGNGTEETVRWLQPHIETNEVNTASYFGPIFSPVYKPWYDVNDSKNVFFVSVHGYGPRQHGFEHLMPQAAFYPGSGKTTIPTDVEFKDQPLNEINKDLTFTINQIDNEEIGRDDQHDQRIKEMDDDQRIKESNDEDDDDDDDDDYEMNEEDEENEDENSNGEDLPRHDSSSYQSKTVNDLKKMFNPISENKPLILDVGVSLPAMNEDSVNSNSEYRHKWRNYFRDIIFPRLLAFKPDAIFISAGFDAHKKDTINAGYISLVEDDFEWITTQLVRISNTCCNGRIISALEGGYQLGGEFSSAFAKSVKAHVNALAIGGKSKSGYNQNDAEIEKNFEKNLLEEIERRRQEKILAQQNLLYQEKSNLSTDANVEENQSSGKRRRAQVDYAALDIELNRKKVEMEKS